MKNSFLILRLVILIGSIFFLSINLFAQFTNIRVDSHGSFPPEEVSIALDPVNPNFLAVGANLSYIFYSSDGGYNWTTNSISSTYGVYGDPCVIYDGLGNLFYSHLSYGSIADNGYWLDRMVIQKSIDHGLSWNNGSGAGFNPNKEQDKDWLGVDLSSSNYRNNLYIVWTQFDSYGSYSPTDSSRILCSHSTDHGNSWSTPIIVSDVSGNCVDSSLTDEGAVPSVGPDGEVYLSWAGPLGIMFDKSTDGGLTFGKDVFVTSEPGGWAFDVPGISRCNGLPQTACDTSHSIYRGNIYILWDDQRNGKDNTDIFLIKSTDKGNSWGNIVKVNNDNSNKQQFFPWMAIDQTTGYIYVVFYDRRNTADSATDVYLAKSTDGGNTFQNFKISQSSFLPNRQVFFGDYINIIAYKGLIYPVWMRMDNNALSIWTCPIKDSTALVSVKENPHVIETFNLEQNYPNPFNPDTKISFDIPEAGQATIKLYNSLGEEVGTLLNQFLNKGKHSVYFNAEINNISLASGVYYYRLTSGTRSETKKMVLLK